MKKNKELLEIIQYIEEKIKPITLNEIGKSNITVLLNKYGLDKLQESIDISFKNYISLNADGKINEDSVEMFLGKIGGIAYNNSLSPMDRAINHIKNYGYKSFSYWNDKTAQAIINKYINSLRKVRWSDNQIVHDLENDVMDLIRQSSNWSQWREQIEGWIQDIEQWDDQEEKIEDDESILPAKLYSNTRNYIEQLSKQINSSYENNLYDCTAVIMRRLMEVLLILSFQNHDIESKILDKTGHRHVSLEKIIKIAQNEKKFNLSGDTKQDMDIFRELGNLSAHKIWYNCTKKDIETLILKYRATVEELLYTAGIIN